MKKPPQKSPLAADVAIDGSKDENGYLENARKNNENARLIGSAIGVAPVLADGRTFNAIICHGSDGMIMAGSGDEVGALSQLININNVSTLGFNDLGPTTDLVIYSCHTGAGLEGAQLLFALATQAKCTVWAPTGFIFLDDKGRFSLQRNAEWQKATARGQPAPKPHASPPTVTASSPPSGGTKAPRHLWDRVAKLSYGRKPCPVVPSKEPAAVEPMSNCGSATEAKRLVKALGLATPYRIRGAPGALHTGDLEFELENGASTYRFRVLSNRLIEEVGTGLFYFTKEAVSSILQ